MTDPLDINPWSIWDTETIASKFGLSLEETEELTRQARKDGLLEFTRLGSKVFYKGSWIFNWMQHESTEGKRLRDEKKDQKPRKRSRDEVETEERACSYLSNKLF